MNHTETTAVIPSCDIEALLAERERVKTLADTIHASATELESLGGDFPGCGNYRNGKFSASGALKEWERRKWSSLLDRSGLADFMDAKARAEWRRQYDDNDFPPFTQGNIEAAFDGIMSQRGDMLSRGVRELFARLSSHHKTNKANAFTGKVIIGYVCEVWKGRHSYRSIKVGGNVDLIDDLNRTIHVCRGLPTPTRDACASVLMGNACKESATAVAVFPFFKVRMFYGAGTAHVVFDHDEDVRRINAMLSMSTDGMQLPDTKRHRF